MILLLPKKSKTPTAPTVRASSYHLPNEVNRMNNLTDANQLVINGITLTQISYQRELVVNTELLVSEVSA
ncbi:hypothetical protein [Photorhabdus akhurstii]|uniref:hypothetical protein n=1 Tax=Photorhabdus akhurstii TaxID=171438 RepID=UPI003704A5F2